MKSRGEYKKLYNSSSVLRNMEVIYNNCTSDDLEIGRLWYGEANNFSIFLSNKYNISEMKCAGIISALSPLKYWEENKIIAESFIKTRGKSRKHFFVQNKKAQYILDYGDSVNKIERELNGLKTINFFNNIYNPEDVRFVTCDVHHLTLSLGTTIKECTDKQYLFIKENSIIFANKLNMIPNQLQASLWVCWKRIKQDFIWQKE